MMMTNAFCSVIYLKLFSLWMEAHFLPSSLLMRSPRASPLHRIMISTQVIHPTFLLSISRPLHIKRLNLNLKRVHGGGDGLQRYYTDKRKGRYLIKLR
jgi:hypothetical protein